MRLAVTWEMAGYVDVEANTLEEAMEKFREESDYIKLPNGDYVDEPEYNVLFSVHIKCADCGLSGFKNFTYKAKNPIQRTIDYWNTRAYEAK